MNKYLKEVLLLTRGLCNVLVSPVRKSEFGKAVFQRSIAVINFGYVNGHFGVQKPTFRQPLVLLQIEHLQDMIL